MSQEGRGQERERARGGHRLKILLVEQIYGRCSRDELTKTALSKEEGEADIDLKENIGDNCEANLGVPENEALGGIVFAFLCSDLDDNSELRLPANNLGRAAPPGASTRCNHRLVTVLSWN